MCAPMVFSLWVCTNGIKIGKMVYLSRECNPRLAKKTMPCIVVDCINVMPPFWIFCNKLNLPTTDEWFGRTDLRALLSYSASRKITFFPPIKLVLLLWSILFSLCHFFTSTKFNSAGNLILASTTAAAVAFNFS